ncbi:MAG: hypothetical protein N3B16_06720, partial [Candidatus Aminicenantes bacterium]|nr:hypothetical protein [Candidatus Aminicenantes bacterium]
MINVLILPHAIPHKKLKARTLEISKELSKDQIFKIFYLERGLMRDDLLYGIKNGFKKSIVYRQIDKIIFIRIPYIPALIEPLLTYNRGIIKKIIKDLNIHLIINNFSHSFSISPSNKYVYIYDYVDDYASFHKNIFIKILMNNFIKKEVKKADFLPVGTTALGERSKRKKWKARYMWFI